VGLYLPGYVIGQPPFGQVGKKPGIEHKSHDRAVSEDDKWKCEVKFLRCHAYFSVNFLKLLQDEVPILRKMFAARVLMSVSFFRKPASLCEVLWADDKSKPYKNIYGGCP